MSDPAPGSRRAFAEVVRRQPIDLGLACLLIGGEADLTFDPAGSLAELDALAGQVDPARPPVEALRAVLAGFSGDAADYADLRSSLLHEVLRRRTGLPILLSVVWLEVARRCGIQAEGIGLPGHFVVRIGGRDGEYVDPFAGGAPLSVPGEAGEQLPGWPAESILLRILNNIRNWAGRQPARARVRLWAVELSLLLPRHPVDLRRERAALLASLGDFLTGAAELENYADLVAPADSAAAERARRDAKLLRSRLN